MTKRTHTQEKNVNKYVTLLLLSVQHSPLLQFPAISPFTPTYSVFFSCFYLVAAAAAAVIMPLLCFPFQRRAQRVTHAHCFHREIEAERKGPAAERETAFFFPFIFSSLSLEYSGTNGKGHQSSISRMTSTSRHFPPLYWQSYITIVVSHDVISKHHMDCNGVLEML